MVIHDDSWWSGKSSGIFSGGILYHMILISNIFTCNGPVLAPWRHPHLLGTGMEMQSRELRVLRKAATVKQFFAKGIGSCHGFPRKSSWIPKGTKKAPKRGTMAGINPTRPNPKEFPSTPNRTNTDLIWSDHVPWMPNDGNRPKL